MTESTPSATSGGAAPDTDLVNRFVRWFVAAAVVGALLYLGASVYAGFDEMRSAFSRFAWGWLPVLVALTLTNYGLRFAKWHYLLRRLGVDMPLSEDLWNFLSGLAMVISPGKLGELLKPYVVRARTGATMMTTIPALVAERLTDGVATLMLAAVGVATYAADQTLYVVALLGVIAAGLGVLASESLSLWVLGLLGRLPVVGRVVPKLEEMYRAMRVCLAPVPFLVTVVVSVVAWFAECVAYWLVLRGLDVDATLDVSTFIYASATVLGAPAPGGLGVADGALAFLATSLVGASQSDAVASALIARVVTLWLGVGLGALALVQVSRLLGGKIDLKAAADDEA